MARNKTDFNFYDGIPVMNDYNKLINSDSFKSIESFSNNFISMVGDQINEYNTKWVSDPLHQWSRQWEYSYIINRASSMREGAKAIDLGAGMTFLPYYIQRNMKLDITSIDYDPMLNELYKSVNKKMGNEIKFQSCDMRDMARLSSNYYDFAYSVSVLEHTDSFEEIFEEIYRILKPGGKFSFTFDISIDGLDDIPVTRAIKFLNSMWSTFQKNPTLDLKYELGKHDIIISSKVIKQNKSLSPWRYPIINVIKPMLNRGLIGSRYKNLTVCCVTVEK